MNIRSGFERKLFAVSITAIAVIFTTAANYIALPEEMFLETFLLGNIIALILGSSISYYVGGQILQNHKLHTDIARLQVADKIQAEQMRAALERERSEARRNKQFRDGLIANISHELRTPMNGVLGMCSLMEQDEPNAKQDDRLKVLRASAEDMLALVNDFLDSSVAANRRLTLNYSQTDLGHLLKNLAERHKAAADINGCRLVVNLDDACTAEKWAVDPLKFSQVISNFVTNAIKYASGGPIWVSVTNPQPGWLRVEVEDRGQGLDESERLQVFERFHQLDKSEHDRGGGVGLGLDICQQIVKAFGGTIGVTPAVPHGSVFWFETRVEQAEHSDADRKYLQDAQSE